MALPTITEFRSVPEFARGYVRDIRARWAFEEIGRAYAVQLVDGDFIKSGAHRRHQPFGQIPTLSDGDIEIFESGAIVIHIAEGTVLMPSEPARRIRAIQWVIAALNSVEPQVKQFAATDGDDACSTVRRPQVLAELNARLAGSDALGDKEWIDGHTFTAGDLMLISVLGDLRDSGVLEGYPALTAYVARGEARQAYRRAMADHLAVYTDAV